MMPQPFPYLECIAVAKDGSLEQHTIFYIVKKENRKKKAKE